MYAGEEHPCILWQMIEGSQDPLTWDQFMQWMSTLLLGVFLLEGAAVRLTRSMLISAASGHLSAGVAASRMESALWQATESYNPPCRE
jgi:hypothetical protein